MTKRTDIHREGAIIPADYEYIFSYSLATTSGGWPIPSYNVNCVLDNRAYGSNHSHGHSQDGTCCVIGLIQSGARMASYGTTGKCTICGAAFIYGDIWRHIHTGEYIHVGHTCADKMNYVNRDGFDQKRERFVKVTMGDIRLNEFYKEYPEFEKFFAIGIEKEHRILCDMRNNVREWGNLTEKQLTFARKIAMELLNPEPKEEEKEPEPLILDEGRIILTGRFVGVKSVESQFGYVRKGLLLVQNNGKLAKVWTTVPNGCDPTTGEVQIAVTLKKGDKPGFYFGSRPLFSG